MILGIILGIYDRIPYVCQSRTTANHRHYAMQQRGNLALCELPMRVDRISTVPTGDWHASGYAEMTHKLCGPLL